MIQDHKPTVRRIAFIGNYIPRQCGIATFTTDLAEAVATTYPETTCFALAMNDIETGYEYLPRVRFELSEKDVISYHRAADYLNVNEVDVVSLQHEYGIFGGPAGSHILSLLREIRMPVVTTLHTVLKDPDPTQLKVMAELAELSNRLVVMSKRGEEFLREVYRIPEEKIDFIPHGIPDVPFVDPNFYKDHFEVEGKTVLLTFGLLSPNKGLENVIKALPRVIDQYPDLVYIVLGTTHPNVLRNEGETYRESLQELAQRLGVSRNIVFDKRFVSQEELIEYIGAADIYITPYLNAQQITSGTLAYTVGAGKAVISTPYWYAEELLADERGVLVPFEDPEAIARNIIELLQNEALRHSMRKRAYLFGRDMVWHKVAQRYMESFEKARQEPITRPRILMVAKKHEDRQLELPPINLYHLSRLTDSTGILQHAVYTLPNYREGYATDDNARALIVAILLERLGDEWFTGAEEFGVKYLSFLWNAYDKITGRFHNFFSYDRRWTESIGSEDCHGRSIWAVGSVAGRSNHDDLRAVAGMLFSWGLQKCLELTSPRAWAFSLLGIDEYLKRFSGDRVATGIGIELAQRLMDLYVSINSPEWHWFENNITYCNASLSHALLTVGQWSGQKEMVKVGLESLSWLLTIQRSPEGFFSPIGNHGFYTRGSEKASFDQQPVEAYETLSACLEAFRLTEDEYWKREADRCFDWFLGGNVLGIPLYDAQTGGCKDGLHSDSVNQNQGAESTLSFYLSLLEMRLMERYLRTASVSPAPITMLPLRAPIDSE